MTRSPVSDRLSTLSTCLQSHWYCDTLRHRSESLENLTALQGITGSFHDRENVFRPVKKGLMFIFVHFGNSCPNMSAFKTLHRLDETIVLEPLKDSYNQPHPLLLQSIYKIHRKEVEKTRILKELPCSSTRFYRGYK